MKPLKTLAFAAVMAVCAQSATADFSQMSQNERNVALCTKLSGLLQNLATGRDNGVPRQESLKIVERNLGAIPSVQGYVRKMTNAIYDNPGIGPIEISAYSYTTCLSAVQ